MSSESLKDPFEVSSVGPIKSKQEPGAPMKELKAPGGGGGGGAFKRDSALHFTRLRAPLCQIVKFKKPPMMTSFKLERLELEDSEDFFHVNKKGPKMPSSEFRQDQAIEHFKPTKELTGYDMDMVENWMPDSPNYRPYCAMRDPKQWDSLAELLGLSTYTVTYTGGP